MASIISAGTTSNTALNMTADTSGTLALQSNGTTIMTITSTGVTTQVGAPAFSAYASSATQTITIGTWTKVLFQTEDFDTNSNFASSRFTPTVEGYYQINSCVAWPGNPTSGNAIALYKNGSIFKIGSYVLNGNIGPRIVMSTLVYANGSSDYFEIYVINNTAANLTLNTAGQADTWINGSMTRSA